MQWVDYFKLNHEQRRTIPWQQGVEVPETMRADFVRSLQRFQLGESGDGRCLRRNALAEPPEYREALEWFYPRGTGACAVDGVRAGCLGVAAAGMALD